MVILGKKHLPDFNLLQMREQLYNKLKINLLSKEHPATIFVFDILKLKEKRDLTKMKLLERKKILKQQIKNFVRSHLLHMLKMERNYGNDSKT